jgi:hypothetical protein
MEISHSVVAAAIRNNMDILFPRLKRTDSDASAAELRQTRTSPKQSGSSQSDE